MIDERTSTATSPRGAPGVDKPRTVCRVSPTTTTISTILPFADKRGEGIHSKQAVPSQCIHDASMVC